MELYNISKKLGEDNLSFICKVNLTKLPLEQYKKFNKSQKDVFNLLRSKTVKNRYLLRLVIKKRLSKYISLADFKDAFAFFKKVSKNPTEIDCIANFHLDSKKFEAYPSLPIESSEKIGKMGKFMITGVKLAFTDNKSELKGAFVDFSPCVECNTVHLIINTILRKKINFSERDIMALYRIAVINSQIFYREKKSNASKNS